VPKDFVCKECILDHTATDLGIDEHGVCHFCREYRDVKATLEKNLEESEDYFRALREQLGQAQQGKYDSIIGLSGGVDSSYVALLANRMGLNPLLVHFDNGWNSETAVSNIKKISNSCSFDLDTYVIDWPEFRDLQRSFIQASVVDIEMLTDHAIIAALFRLAKKHNVKYVLSGTNQATEFGLPRSWIWNKLDWVNIKAIHSKFGELKLKTFPRLPTWRYIAMRRLGLGIQFLSPLDHIEYRKSKAIDELQTEFDWQYYGGKHYESVFTKFYQAHILPNKFNIDKRKAHLSSLVRNGEMSRDEALKELKSPLYDQEQLENDMTFVLKKLGFSRQEFEQIMREVPVPHRNYGTDETQFEIVLGAYHKFRGAIGMPKKIRN
jgi:N-acetyl sugar amidotransferase